MSFSINTNVASLSAQNYLRVNSNFQGQTINRVTSGLRIVQSGDDAAGLAIANGYRSDQAVLTQGVRNANDGLSQLQIVDGGMNNISQLLDRARTLATQSASGTFTGDRSVLNNEFQSVLGEIDRQAQSIGLDTGGIFAKSLSVFIGGGKSNGAISAVQNGSVSVDLSKSIVDSKSLGLLGVQSIGTAGTDIGPNSATSVAQILGNTTNTGSEATSGYTNFSISGPGFTGAHKINVSVNLSGVTDANTLVTNINNAIQAAGAGSTQYATAFKNSQITASLNTDSTGKTQLTFSSSTSAFQVQAGDRVANALLGNFSSGSTGAALTTSVTGSANVANPTLQNIVSTTLPTSNVITSGSNDTFKLTVGGTTASLTLAAGTYTQSQLASQINTQVAGSGLAGDLTASVNSSNQLVLTAATTSQAVTVVAPASHDAAGTLGFVDAQTSSTTPTLTTNDSVTLQFSGGGLDSPVNVTLNQFVAGTSTVNGVLSDLNTKVSGNSQLAAAGIKVSTSTAGNALVFTNSEGQRLNVNATGDSANVLGLGTFIGTNTNAYDYTSLTATNNYVQTGASGTAQVGVSINGGSNQVISANLAGGDATAGAIAGSASVLAGVALTAGHVIKLAVDGTTKTISLTGGAPETAATILSDFSAGLGASASVSIDTSGHLNIKSATTGTSSSVQVLTTGTTATAGELTGLGLPAAGTAASVGQNASETNVLQQLNSAIASNSTLAQAGIKAVDNSGKIELTSTNGTHFRLDTYGAADLGFGNSGASFTGNISSSAPGASPYFDAQGETATSALSFAPVTFGGDQQTLSFSAIDSGGAAHTTAVSLNNTNAGSIDQALSTINTTLQQSNDKTLQKLVAVKEDTGASTLTGGTALAASTAITTGSNDSLNLTVGGTSATLTLAQANYSTSALATQINTQIGSSSLNGLVTASVDSSNHLVLTASTPTQTVQVNNVANDAASTLGVTDGQVSANEGIKFVSSLNNFNVSVGTVGETAGSEGVGSASQQGTVVSGATVGTGSTADISNQASAESAVTALASAVSTLGSAQAVVGRGENQFNYAINLAQSQLTNLATAESRIRDADLASEAANLTKAQILMQAGVAALAQANSAPQQVLTLLRG